jgi:hypothetical protein
MEIEMPPSPAPSSNQSNLIALLVILVDGEIMLCPFFAKCDGVLVIDPDSGRREFLAKTNRTIEAMCDLILRTGADRLILGFKRYMHDLPIFMP